MPVSKEQVLAALEGVKSPDGIPLPRGGTLSEVVVGDGKVFFSITVDADAVKAWEPIRERAEAAVRAVPGVQSAWWRLPQSVRPALLRLVRRRVPLRRRVPRDAPNPCRAYPA